MISALFVAKGGCYFEIPDVDPWDKSRDARGYTGPWPVVAHPPCERWGRYWGGSPTQWPRLILGDDQGCFEAALKAVRSYGGVLEHPEGSHAWRAFHLKLPPHHGGWVSADFDGGWTCCVEQGHYGHQARKKTWLYAHGVDLPSLKWGRSSADGRLDDGFHSAAERQIWKETSRGPRYVSRTGICQRLSKRARSATPEAFRDLLLAIAASARGQAERLAA